MNTNTMLGLICAGVLVALYGVLAGMNMPVDESLSSAVIGALIGISLGTPVAYNRGKHDAVATEAPGA